MTLGIAMTVRDVVVFAADGRLSTFPDNQIVSDTQNKVVQLLPTVFAVPAGLTLVTDSVITTLQVRLQQDLEVEDLSAMCVEVLAGAWQFASRTYIGKGLEGSSRYKAALLVGGLDPSGSRFLLAFQQNEGEALQNHLVLNTREIRGIGAEPEELQALVNVMARKIASNLESQETPWNPFVRLAVNEIAGQIQAKANRDPTVGGTIHYAVIRKGSPAIQGIWISPLA